MRLPVHATASGSEIDHGTSGNLASAEREFNTRPNDDAEFTEIDGLELRRHPAVR